MTEPISLIGALGAAVERARDARSAPTDDSVIEAAAKAIVEVQYPEIAWGLLAEGRKEFRREQARAAFAVFEKAHAKELDTSTELVKQDGDSLHVAPADDELARQALDLLDEMNSESRISYADYATLHGMVSELADRRPEVPEPHEHTWQNRVSGGSKCAQCDLWQDKRVEPQGEPSDEQVVAAWDAFYTSDDHNGGYAAMRDALRAAGQVKP